MRRWGSSGLTSGRMARSSGASGDGLGVGLGGATATSTPAGGTSVGMSVGGAEGASAAASMRNGSTDPIASDGRSPASGGGGEARGSTAGACGAMSGLLSSGSVGSGSVRWAMLARPSTSPTVAGAAQRAAVARPNRSRRRVRAPRRVAGREYDQPRLEYTRVSHEAGRSWPCVGAMSRGGHKQVGRACATTPLYRVRPCARQTDGWPRGVSGSSMRDLIRGFADGTGCSGEQLGEAPPRQADGSEPVKGTYGYSISGPGGAEPAGGRSAGSGRNRRSTHHW